MSPIYVFDIDGTLADPDAPFYCPITPTAIAQESTPMSIKLIKTLDDNDIEETTERITTGERDLDGDEIEIFNQDGFGATDVSIAAGPMTWKQWDVLKKAMELAEKAWRPKS